LRELFHLPERSRGLRRESKHTLPISVAILRDARVLIFRALGFSFY
jgi:hypothetical protein